MCYSNQGLIDQVVADARKFFDGQGAEAGAEAAGKYFAMVPMDGGAGALVQVPRLSSADRPGATNREPFRQQRECQRLLVRVRQQGGPRGCQDPSRQVHLDPRLCRLLVLPAQGAAGAEHLRADVPAHAELVGSGDEGE